MQDLVGIIRTESELVQAVEKLGEFKERVAGVGAKGGVKFNASWHTALDLNAMLTVSEACAKAALMRKESRGGHTRDDYPKADPDFGKINHVVRLQGNVLRGVMTIGSPSGS